MQYLTSPAAVEASVAEVGRTFIYTFRYTPSVSQSRMPTWSVLTDRWSEMLTRNSSWQEGH